MTNMVEMTPEKTKALRKAYLAALEAGQETFDFEGNTLLVAYAKYLLEYLEGQFGGTNG